MISLFTPIILLATTIIAAVAPNRIVLGADSLSTIYEDNSKHGLVCKIESTHGIAFTSTGVMFVGDERNHFLDTSEIAQRALLGANDVIDAADRFAPLFREPMLRILADQKVKSPKTYQTHVGKELLIAMFAGWRDVGPVVLIQKFVLNPPTLVEDRSFLTAKPGNNWTVYGQFDAIARYMKTFGPFSFDPIEQVRRSINLEIQEKPQFVGAPLSILEIRQNGQRWIEQGQCSEMPQ